MLYWNKGEVPQVYFSTLCSKTTYDYNIMNLIQKKINIGWRTLFIILLELKRALLLAIKQTVKMLNSNGYFFFRWNWTSSLLYFYYALMCSGIVVTIACTSDISLAGHHERRLFGCGCHGDGIAHLVEIPPIRSLGRWSYYLQLNFIFKTMFLCVRYQIHLHFSNWCVKF